MQGSPGKICSPTTIMAGCQQFKTYHQGRQPPPFWFHSIPGRRGKLPAAIGQCYPKLRVLAAGNGVGVPRLALLSLPTSLLQVFYHYLFYMVHIHSPTTEVKLSQKHPHNPPIPTTNPFYFCQNVVLIIHLRSGPIGPDS